MELCELKKIIITLAMGVAHTQGKYRVQWKHNAGSSPHWVGMVGREGVLSR